MTGLLLTFGLLFQGGLAYGQEPSSEDTPAEEKVVGPVVEGQVVEVEGERGPLRFRLDQRYWLIRDDALRTAVANARAVPQLEAALGECRQASIQCGLDTAAAWATMREQFDIDTSTMDSLRTTNAHLLGKTALLEADVQRLRRQRTTAYVVLGTVAAAVLVGTGVGLGVGFSVP
jgi:hypothetical protein